jgi:hypothetical protein
MAWQLTGDWAIAKKQKFDYFRDQLPPVTNRRQVPWEVPHD